MTTFWQTATQEQKLAQIDGGIECGMNARQVGTNCGAMRDHVLRFAQLHGRHFAAYNVGAHSRRRSAERFRCEKFKQNTARFGSPHEDAFSIFDNHSEAFELEWPA